MSTHTQPQATDPGRAISPEPAVEKQLAEQAILKDTVFQVAWDEDAGWHAREVARSHLDSD